MTQVPLVVSGLWHGTSLLDLAGLYARPFFVFARNRRRAAAL